MPYNNAAILPPDEVTGTSALPLARIKRIIGIDEDINQCSSNAAFMITVATEQFIRYLAEQAYNVAKSERKPRRNVQYKDFANAVSRIDNLEFLTDVIPKTMTYKQYKEKRAKESSNTGIIERGQTTLDPNVPEPNGTSEIINSDGEADNALDSFIKKVNERSPEADTDDGMEMEVDGDEKASTETGHDVDIS